jgi:hypothetical protein
VCLLTTPMNRMAPMRAALVAAVYRRTTSPARPRTRADSWCSDRETTDSVRPWTPAALRSPAPPALWLGPPPSRRLAPEPCGHDEHPRDRGRQRYCRQGLRAASRRVNAASGRCPPITAASATAGPRSGAST